MISEIVPRRVYLSIESQNLRPDRISEIAGIQPDDAIAKGSVREDSVSGRPSGQNSWSLVEFGSAADDISEIVEKLYDRILNLKATLIKLKRLECDITFHIVLYHSEGDEGRRGFALDIQVVRFLADIGASLDVEICPLV